MNKIGQYAKTALLGTLITTAQAVEWDDINVIQVNTEKPHTTLMVYPDVAAAKSYDKTKSIWFKSLNGDWKFNWSLKPADRPEDFYQTNFNDSSWTTIPVPSNWEMEGHGLRWYTNKNYPFPQDQPKAPHNWNPVGS